VTYLGFERVLVLKAALLGTLQKLGRNGSLFATIFSNNNKIVVFSEKEKLESHALLSVYMFCRERGEWVWTEERGRRRR